MKRAATVLVGLVALEHLGFLVMEMVLWNTAFVRHAFGTTPEFAAQSAALAANQGLYNGFLAAGLLWGLWIDSGRVAVFFLGCVIVAGLFGAVTVKPAILFIQALPAAVALACVVLSRTRMER